MALTKGFNKYKVDDDVVTIYFENRKRKVIMEGYFDTEELGKIKSLDLCWSATWSNFVQDYYAKANEYYYDENGKRKAKSYYLHRIIMNAEKEDIVDHKEHGKGKTLDNRKSNLRLTKVANNSRNRKGANKNSGTGHRNVNWGSDRREYWVQFCRDGERFKWKFPLSQFQEACDFADEKRVELFGEYAGKH